MSNSKVRIIIRSVLIFICTIFFQSCGVILTWVHGSAYALKTKNTIKQAVEIVDSLGKRSIILIPMVHVGSKEDFEKIGSYVDGLKSKGYVTFYEGVTRPESLDSAAVNLLCRKYRKILGSYYARIGQMLKKHDNWICQTADMNKTVLHLSTDKDISADVSLVEIIEYFEKEYGREVELDEYDLSCPLSDLTYKPKKLTDSYWALKKTAVNFRDDRLLELVMSSNHDKIAVIYGGVHTCNLKFNLLARGYHYKYPK